MAKKVTVIQAVSDWQHTAGKAKLKVCGYVRVSTGSKAQAESYAAQVEYYTRKIEDNPLWEFVGIYADEAVTGTKVKGRDEFQTMIQDCEEGNIDLILTKSVTRFARNTLESIQTIRKLKALGIGLYFEKENINTLTEKSELMITVLSSIAQGESEDFSGNNRWSIIKRFQDGSYIIGTPAYGYVNDEDGNLTIQPEEAEVVREIFDLYLNGMGTYLIAKKLNEQGIPTIRKSDCWQDSVIKGILQNPVYEGDLLQQKTYTERKFPFVSKSNHGEREQYLITDNHPPIITREEAQAVRDIMKYRSDILHMDGEKYKNRYLFTSRIVCEECGSYFRRQKIYIGKPYEKIIWTCHMHVKDKEICKMKAIREDVLHGAFLSMWNKLYTNQGTVLEPLLDGLKNLPNSPKDAEENKQLDREILHLTEQSRILNQVMKKGYMDSAIFMENYNGLSYRLLECRRRKAVLAGKQRRSKEIVKTEQLIGLLKDETGPLKEFREDLFDLMVKEIRISKGHEITFCMHNGLKLKEQEGGEDDAMAYANGI